MSYNATILQAAQASQGALVRGWLASPAPPAEAPVPDPGAQVDAAVMDLENKLHEVQLEVAPHVTTAAETPYTAARAAADAQFNLHMKNGCNCPPMLDRAGSLHRDISTGNAGKWRNPPPPVGVTGCGTGTPRARHGLVLAAFISGQSPLRGNREGRGRPCGRKRLGCRSAAEGAHVWRELALKQA